MSAWRCTKISTKLMHITTLTLSLYLSQPNTKNLVYFWSTYFNEIVIPGNSWHVHITCWVYFKFIPCNYTLKQENCFHKSRQTKYLRKENGNISPLRKYILNQTDSKCTFMIFKNFIVFYTFAKRQVGIPMNTRSPTR